jgi:hypothetical protein
MAELQHALYEHRGTRAVQRMVEHAPSTGGLALWCRHADRQPDAAEAAARAAPLVSTDGHTLFYASAFDTLPVAEQAGHVAHGVLHIALRHPQRFLALQALIGDADLQLFNVCADAIVNSALSHLAWLALPANAVGLEQLIAATLGDRPSAESALAQWDVESLYRALDDRDPGAPGRSQALVPQPFKGEGTPVAAQRRDGPRSARARQLGAAAAQDLKPSEQTRSAPEDEADQIRLWSERLLRGHAGDSPTCRAPARRGSRFCARGWRGPWPTSQGLRGQGRRGPTSPIRAGSASTTGCRGSPAPRRRRTSHGWRCWSMFRVRSTMT